MEQADKWEYSHYTTIAQKISKINLVLYNQIYIEAMTKFIPLFVRTQ